MFATFFVHGTQQNWIVDGGHGDIPHQLAFHPRYLATSGRAPEIVSG